MNKRIQAYYEANPLMVSSPFGGVDGINEALLHDVMARLDLEFADKTVLDAGCGRGFLSREVQKQGGEYTGADVVANAQDCRFVMAGAEALPFPDRRFDLVCCIDAFEHVPDAAAAAREFKRVLRPGGTVFLSVPNYTNAAGLVKWYCETFGRYERNTWAPFRAWQPQELEHFMTAGRVRQVFRAAGFTGLRRIAHGVEVGGGLFPWIEHAKMPEAIKFRLQKLFAVIGPAVGRVWPGASLHGFWRIEE